MKNFNSDAYVVGTAALQPNCSRHSNENENIIAFPAQETEPEFYTVDFAKLAGAQHLSLENRFLALVQHLVQKSSALYDLCTGDIEGKPFWGAPRSQMVIAGTSYCLIAVLAIFIAA